jgi:NitT/TauT family transport system substrate-binding protein
MKIVRCGVPVILLLTVAACSRSSATETGAGSTNGSPSIQASSGAPLKLTTFKVPALCTLGWSVARQKGYFADEGLDVDLLPLDLSSAHDHFLAWVKGPNGRVRTDLTVIEHAALADVATGRLDYYVVAGEHSGCHQLVVPARSTARTIADLKGKRIGITTVEDTGPWDYLARQARLPRGALKWEFVPVPNGGPEEEKYVREAFAAGRLDGFVTTDPVGEILKMDGVARLLVSNTWTPPLNNWYCCMLGVRRELVDRNPKLPAAMTRAIRRASRFIENEPGSAIDLAIGFGQLPRDTRREMSARLIREYVWATAGRIEDDLERYFGFLIEAGKLPATASPRELVRQVYRPGE